MQKTLKEILNCVQKPARYVGGEIGAVYKNKNEISVRFAFCFPDIYEIGMSHLGMKILYDVLNRQKDYWCERVFTPWVDFEQQMIEKNLPLYALESHDALYHFDVIGFSLQYELSYTNVLHMLSLGKIPLLKKHRTSLKNLVVAGGPCTCNPEPLCDFIDVFFLGEGEEQLLQFMQLYQNAKKKGLSKDEFLKQAVHIQGVYVPSFYEVYYHDDGRVNHTLALADVPTKVRKAIVSDFDQSPYPEQFIIPYLPIVHDRSIIELMRGCIRGCRFCQAGFLYRPLREKTPQTLYNQLKRLTETTGYEEVSLNSLSTSDYSLLHELLDACLDYTEKNKIGMTLPSLRVDNFSDALLAKIAKVKKSGLTFAPEAGSQRLRNVINKNVTEEEIMETCRIAFEGGYHTVKLYFMIGLPTETMEDIAEIARLAERILQLYYKVRSGKGGARPEINISVATFVPKPFTPFQWEAQDTPSQILEKQTYLLKQIKSRNIKLHWHDVSTSVLEAVLAKGDRRLGKVILYAYQNGCRLDSWEEYFKFSIWEEAFRFCGLDFSFYANRKRSFQEVMPWEHLDYGVHTSFLQEENRRAWEAKTTPNCREACSGCGINRIYNCNAKVKGGIMTKKQKLTESSSFYTYRLFYKKGGVLSYISHLDMNRFMQRALQRSNLPIWYTQGFHPHPYVTFALPLSLGFESTYECMDFRLCEAVSEKEIARSLIKAFDGKVEVIRVALPVHTAKEITAADYRLFFPCELKEKWMRFLKEKEIFAFKKTKKGKEQKVELSPLLKNLYWEETERQAILHITLPAGVKMCNPNLLIHAFQEYAKVDDEADKIVRDKLYCKDGAVFV